MTRTGFSCVLMSVGFYWLSSSRALGDDNWCKTLTPEVVVCGTSGTCDSYATRDSYSIAFDSYSSHKMKIRLRFVVMQDDDGENGATQSDVNAQMSTLNTVYNSYGITFEADTPATFPHSSRYLHFCSGLTDSECICTSDVDCRDGTGCSDTEEYAMKSAHSSLTTSRLNIYVVNVEGGNSPPLFRGVALFPWCTGATGTMNGIIVDKDYFGSSGTVLVHEIGHALGLWHTFHGTQEVGSENSCSYCSETTDCDGTPSSPWQKSLDRHGIVFVSC